VPTAPQGSAEPDGKVNCSSQEKCVASPARERKEKRPFPLTTPWWWTPIASQGFHSVIDMTSVSRMGPTLVTQMNSVPTPVRAAVVKRIDSASFIHRTCDSIFSSAAHASPADALTCVETEIRMLMASPGSVGGMSRFLSRRSVSCTGRQGRREDLPCQQALGNEGQGDVGPLADQVVALLANLLVLEQLVDGENS